MSNTLLTNDEIVAPALALFKNNLALGNTANRDYEAAFDGGEKGDTVRIRKPTQFTVREGKVASFQDIDERNASLTIEHQDGVDVKLSSRDRTLSMDDFVRRILEPAMVNLANKVDARGVTKGMNNIYRYVGTAGTTPNGYGTIDDAAAMLRWHGVLGPELYLAMNPTDAGGVRKGLQNSFNKPFNEDISERAVLGSIAGFDLFEDQNLTSHAVGAHGGSPVVNGASQTGTSLVTAGWTVSTTVLKKGDIIYFDADEVYSVNPVNRQSTGKLATFAVAADVTSDGAGAATIPLVNPITVTGPYATVNKSPSNSAVVNVLGTASSDYTVNFAYSRDAFTLACVKLVDQPGAAYSKSIYDDELGVGIRLIETYDGIQDEGLIRFDVLYGWECFPEYACKVVG